MKSKNLYSIIASILIVVLIPTILSQEVSLGQPSSTPPSLSNPSGGTQQAASFNLQDYNTWADNWPELKKQKIEELNQLWEKATQDQRQKVIEDLIKNSQQNVVLKNMGAKELSLDLVGEGDNKWLRLSNGKSFFDPENLPPNLKQVEFSTQQKGFIYDFKDNSKLTIRNGNLNKDLTISGTDWPSDGIKWNGKGTFLQTEQGVTLEKGGKINLGKMEISQARSGKSVISFKAGDNGNSYVKGENFAVSIKDFAKITTPSGKTTEVFIGDQKVEGSQYVKINEDGSSLEVKGEEIEVEALKDLRKATVDGNKIKVTNKDATYRIEDDKNGKSQTYKSHKPGSTHDFRLENTRNPQGNVNSENTEEQTPSQQQDPDSKPPTNNEQQGSQNNINPNEQSNNNRVKYSFNQNGKRQIIQVKKGGLLNIHAANLQYTVPDQYINNPQNIPPTAPLKLDITSKLNSVLAGRGIERNKLVNSLYKDGNADLLNLYGLNQAERQSFNTVVNTAFPTNFQKLELNQRVSIFSGGQGSGIATVDIRDASGSTIKRSAFTGNQAEALIKYINGAYKREYNIR